MEATATSISVIIRCYSICGFDGLFLAFSPSRHLRDSSIWIVDGGKRTERVRTDGAESRLTFFARVLICYFGEVARQTPSLLSRHVIGGSPHFQRMRVSIQTNKDITLA